MLVPNSAALRARLMGLRLLAGLNTSADTPRIALKPRGVLPRSASCSDGSVPLAW
jgi:hypothetical protein